MEIEYDEELDEFLVVIPENIMNRLGWVEGTYLEYIVEDDMLKLFTTED